MTREIPMTDSCRGAERCRVDVQRRLLEIDCKDHLASTPDGSRSFHCAERESATTAKQVNDPDGSAAGDDRALTESEEALVCEIAEEPLASYGRTEIRLRHVAAAHEYRADEPTISLIEELRTDPPRGLRQPLIPGRERGD
jgi:hypothetical protein